ncbi:MAG: hypothetical protein JW965_00815 [Bacteroidales bacterium]|nr:hypothetical protein [Bacteroidales bacterium]
MLIEVESKTFCNFFPTDPHPFISESFIELNKDKAQRIVRLVENTDRPEMGLIAGIKNGFILSPFSAPFGGFHFRKDIMYISEMDNYISSLKKFIVSQGLKGIEIILPPDIYHLTFNAKAVNSLMRNGFQLMLPEITNWVNLEHFNGKFTQRNSREYYRQALRNKLSFNLATNEEEKRLIYDLIYENRAKFDRPIYMTFNDILNTGSLWPVDYFRVIAEDGTIVASAIFYRNHPDISYAVFWGDNEKGRPLRAMDYLAFELWSYYKAMGYKYIDLGISTENGNPNEGLLRFKESHESTSSLRYKYVWKVNNQQ